MSRWRKERRLVVSAIWGLIYLIAGPGAAPVGPLAVSPVLAAEHRFDGVYTGKRSLTNGSVGPNCPAEEDVSVTIHGETLTFTNSALKKFIIGFDPRQDGSFHEIHTEEGGATVDIVGRIDGDVIDADVTNPPCEQHWHLKKE